MLGAALTVLFNLHRSQAFLLIHNLILHTILLLMLEAIKLLLLLVLLLYNLGLFGFLTPGLENSLLYLAFLISTLLVEAIVVVSIHSLLFVLHLVVVDFLHKTDKRMLTKAIEQTYLLDAVFIALFEGQNLVGTLLRIVDFFPSLLLLLLEQGNTIGQKLGIPLNTDEVHTG